MLAPRFLLLAVIASRAGASHPATTTAPPVDDDLWFASLQGGPTTAPAPPAPPAPHHTAPPAPPAPPAHRQTTNGPAPAPAPAPAGQNSQTTNAPAPAPAPAPAAPAPAAFTVLDCVGHVCPMNYVHKPNPASHHCSPRGCSPTDCCLLATTTPVPTTTPTTCATFTCPPPSIWHAIPGAVICDKGPCTKAVCCFDPTTTPSPTTMPVAAIPRKYDQEVLMQQTNKKTNNGQAWGAIAFFATGGFAVAAAIHVYRRRRSTRRVTVTSAEDGLMPSDTDNLVE